MKNISGSANWFKEKDDVVEEMNLIDENCNDARTFISYKIDDVSHILTSEGKPLVFKDSQDAESYVRKNGLDDYEIDDFKDFNFDGIDIIEL